MNNTRRKALALLIKRLESLHEDIDSIKCDLDEIQEEEQQAYDNMPESLQSSEPGMTMYEYIFSMQSAADELDSIDCKYIIDALSDILGGNDGK